MKGTVEVSEALTVVGGRTEVGPIKNGVRRSVQFSPSMCDDLARHLSCRATELGRGVAADDYVFVAPEGGPLRRDLLHKRICRPAVGQASLPAALRVHDLRHTCASLLIDLGAHPKAIQEWLGHKSITVTIDVYGHLFPSLNEALAEQLDEVFRRAAESPERAPATVVALDANRTPHARP